MVIAYHAIFTTYGTWLPNDPRGSYSTEIYKEELKRLGLVRYGRQNPQPPRQELRRFWTATRPKLNRPPYFIDNATRPAIGAAFARAVAKFNLHCFACAIMNDHVHLLLQRPEHRIEYLVSQGKVYATNDLGLPQTPWSRGSWNVFLNDEPAVRAATRYIYQNPIHAGMPAQNWAFVTPLTP